MGLPLLLTSHFLLVSIQACFVGATLVVALYLWGQPQGLPLQDPLYLYLYLYTPPFIPHTLHHSHQSKPE